MLPPAGKALLSVERLICAPLGEGPLRVIVTVAKTPGAMVLGLIEIELTVGKTRGVTVTLALLLLLL